MWNNLILILCTDYVRIIHYPTNIISPSRIRNEKTYVVIHIVKVVIIVNIVSIVNNSKNGVLSYQENALV